MNEKKEYFRISVEENLAVVTYDRPPVNMMSFAALGQLEKILSELNENKLLSAVVLTGGVDGFFIAHADTDDVMRMENGEPPIGDPDAWDRVNMLLSHMAPVTVAAVNGQAWGGGCETALACDFILVSEAGHFRLVEVSNGVVPGAGGTQRLPRRIGKHAALRMLVTSEVIDSARAATLGLADAVLPAENFMQHVREWLAPILKQPVHAVHGAKRVVAEGMEMSLAEGLALEKSVFQELVSCEETKALGEKKPESLN